MILLASLCSFLFMTGIAFAAPTDKAARLAQSCVENPGYFEQLSAADQNSVLAYLTPTTMEYTVVDAKTGKTVSQATVPVASSQTIMPMSSGYYQIDMGSSPWSVGFLCKVKNVWGVELCRMQENNTWSWNTVTGRINSTSCSSPYVNSFLGWTWVGVVSESSSGWPSSSSYYFQHVVQGHFTLNVGGVPVNNAYPLIDFVDWADYPARITWHCGA